MRGVSLRPNGRGRLPHARGVAIPSSGPHGCQTSIGGPRWGPRRASKTRSRGTLDPHWHTCGSNLARACRTKFAVASQTGLSSHVAPRRRRKVACHRGRTRGSRIPVSNSIVILKRSTIPASGPNSSPEPPRIPHDQKLFCFQNLVIRVERRACDPRGTAVEASPHREPPSGRLRSPTLVGGSSPVDRGSLSPGKGS